MKLKEMAELVNMYLQVHPEEAEYEVIIQVNEEPAPMTGLVMEYGEVIVVAD